VNNRLHAARKQLKERMLTMVTETLHAHALQNYFTQPFFVAEPYTKRSGSTVSLADALDTCRGILDGHYDDLPMDAFFFSGDIAEIQKNIGRSLSWGPVAVK
jgi:F0F1-type ATP synthase beta subunit